MERTATWQSSQPCASVSGQFAAEVQKQEQQRMLYTAALASEHYVHARRRIFRQLVESLLYEGVIAASSNEIQGRPIEWSIPGQGSAGERILYTCKGTRHLTFGRLRLHDEPVMRSASKRSSEEVCCEGETSVYGEEQEATSLSLFLLEVCQGIGADEDKLLNFVRELEQTLINDTLARYARASRQTSELVEDEDWEKATIEGHPYHPSYKSRIGFRMEDQLEYGPEFGEAIRPLWVAVHKDRVHLSHVFQQEGSFRAKGWLGAQWGEELAARIVQTLAAAGADAAEYAPLPVHPWQWRTIVTSVLAEELRNGSIIPLDISDHIYTAQQSIRTLANRSRPELPSLKLSLSIVNTSTSRVIAPHTVQNAPIITDWLKGIVSRDRYLRDELRVIMLGEIAGAAYDNSDLPDPLKPHVYGALSCIWRESVYPMLEPCESVIPFNTLTTLDLSGCPVIEPWVNEYGAEQWLSQLLETSVLPLIHWLFAHGIALESHAQNMLLIHREGKPERLALKDFHDGIRFMRDLLAEPERCPELVDVPEYHRRVNRNSFVVATEPAEVRDFMHDAFFFINLGELALFMQEHYGIAELKFWKRVREIVERYQQRFPQYQARYGAFSLFEPEIGVEQLTKRRMYRDDELRMHQVPNPLADEVAGRR